MVTTSALTTALAAKLDTAGGTMTGALTIGNGTLTASAPVLALSQTLNNAAVAFKSLTLAVTDTAKANGTKFLEITRSSSTGDVFSLYFEEPYTYLRFGGTTSNANVCMIGSRYGALTMLPTNGNGVSIDSDSGWLSLKSNNGATNYFTLASTGTAAQLQLGVNHATSPTDQLIKAHNVTTGVGAALTLSGGGGSVSGGSVKIASPATTGSPVVAIEVAANGLIGLFGRSPTSQATTGIGASAFSANTSGILDDSATFGGYTIGQIAAALIGIGILS